MPTPKRRRSFGKIQQQRSGRYQASYIDGNGERVYAPRTFLKERDAELWLHSVEVDLSRGIAVGNKPKKDPRTLTAYAEKWIETRRINGKPLAPLTLASYRTMLDNHILPSLGDVKVADLNPEKVRTWYASLTSNKIGPYRLLHAILNTASAEDGILAVNPCKVKNGAKQTRPRRNALAPGDIWKIAEAMPKRYKALVLLAAFGGLRIGELAGLQRRDVNFSTGVVRVDRQLQRINGEWVFLDPKSDKGKRDAPPLPDDVWEVLTEHFSAYVKASPDAAVFTTSTGGFLYREYLRRMMNEVSTSKVFPHLLRHTALSLLAEVGATNAELMAYGGHATMATVAIYQHARDERRAVLAAAMNASVRPSPPEC